jgi:predicted transcriptional regulator
MDRHDHEPEMTIRQVVLRAKGRLGLATLAGRAGVSERLIADVRRGGIAHDAPALRRLVETAEAVVGNQARR